MASSRRATRWRIQWVRRNKLHRDMFIRDRILVPLRVPGLFLIRQMAQGLSEVGITLCVQGRL